MVLALASEGWVSFSRPTWLAALAVVVAPVLLARLAARRGRRVPAAAVAGQCLALGVLAFALTGPRAPLTGRGRLPYLLFLDASGSVRGAAQAGWPPLPPGATAERYYFAEGLSRTKPTADAATRLGPVLGQIASHGPGTTAAVILATDGRFTDSGWEGLAAAVARSGLEMLIVPMDSPPADARLAGLTAARQAGEQVGISVTVVSNAPLQRTLTVRRRGREAPLLTRALSLLGHSPATFNLADALPPDAAAEYTAQLSADDAIPENDFAAVLVLPAQEKVAGVGPGPLLQRLLGDLGGRLDLLGGCEKLPDSPAALAAYSGVVVADATGSALTPAQRKALAEYIRAGGGLMLIGSGPHATPADRDDPLNQVLPLVPNPFQRRPLHLRVLLDRSGSMAQTAAARPGGPAQIKFDLAAEAVVALKDHLTPRDALTVIAFADRPEVVYDSGDGPPDFDALRRALQGVRPVGSTNVTPAIAEALTSPPAGGRNPMLLVLSDLRTEDFPPAEWAEKLRQGRVHLAVVAIGKPPADQPAPPLETLVKLMQPERAAYLRQDDLAGLAKVFATLVRQGRGPAVRRQPARLVVAGPLFGTGLNALPDVDAYVLTGKQEMAELLARTTGGEPILARQAAGIGRSVGLALPMGPDENISWQNSPEVSRLLSAAVRWTLRGPNDPRFTAELTRDGSLLAVAVQANQDGRPINDLALWAHVAAGKATAAVRLDQVAPGQYRGQAACPPDTPAAVAIRDDKGATLWRGSAAVTHPPEYRLLGADREGLQRLGSLTGGKIVPAERLAATLRQSYTRRLTELWPWLLGLALALMLTEWCLTRITRL